MKGFVEKDTCLGCGICPGICPEIFTMDEDGKAMALSKEITEELIESAKEAEMQCPVSAITLK